MDQNEKVVHEFVKNKREKVLAVVKEWQGKALIDLRVYYEKDGQWMAGPKGLCLQQDAIENLKAAVKALDFELNGVAS